MLLAKAQAWAKFEGKICKPHVVNTLSADGDR